MNNFAQSSKIPQNFIPAYNSVIEILSSLDKVDDKLWNGYRFREYPLVVYDSKERDALLINFSNPPQNFVALDDKNNFYGKISSSEALIPGPGPFHNRLVNFVDIKTLNQSPKRILIEESFKLFLAYRGFKDLGTFVPGSYPILNAENNYLSRCENLILLKAMYSDPVEIKPLLSTFCSIRTKREAIVPKDILEIENSNELIDGLSSYMGYLVLDEKEKSEFLSNLTKKLEENNKGGFNAEKRFKDSGFALLYLLERLKYDYRNAIDKSSKGSLVEILKPYVANTTPKDIATLLDIEKIREEEINLAKEKENIINATLEKIEKAEGLVIFIKIDDYLQKTEQKYRWVNLFEQEEITYLNTSKIIFKRYFKLSQGENFYFASSRPILVEVRKSITIGFGKDEIPFILVDGKGASFEKDSPPVIASLEIKGIHFEAKIKKAKASWDYTTRRLTIEPILEE